jgi:pimeloyl-ACP methyl ester carboxylesterase
MTALHAVLIHGAWQGSWVWHDFAPFLREAGIEPHAVDLPGNGTDDTPLHEVNIERYIGHVADLIEQLWKAMSSSSPILAVVSSAPALPRRDASG